MIKKNWKILLVTSLILLLPILAGLILWNQLPDQMPTHWNAAGEIDGWSNKYFAVFGLPLMMLGFQWICVAGTSADPKKQNHPEKVIQLVLWIIPVISTLLHTLTYAAALGNEVRMEMIIPLFVGLVLAIVGNYLPKCKQNYTIGIKIPWTLNSEENWNRTHRLAGRIWLVGGLAIMLTGFVGGVWLFLPIVLTMVFVPFIYSYALHRKGI